MNASRNSTSTAVEVTHQIDDCVGVGRVVAVVVEELTGPARVLVVQRCEAGRVDEGETLQR